MVLTLSAASVVSINFTNLSTSALDGAFKQSPRTTATGCACKTDAENETRNAKSRMCFVLILLVKKRNKRLKIFCKFFNLMIKKNKLTFEIDFVM